MVVAENGPAEASLNKLDSAGLLCEWKGRWPLLKLLKLSCDAILESLPADKAPGSWLLESTGDSLHSAAGSSGLTSSSDSASVDMEFLRDDLAPMRLFFCLNFSNQLALLALRWLSEVPTELAKKRAFSRIMASERGRPCF